MSQTPTLLSQISTAYNDPAVKAYPELQAELLKRATQLDQTEDEHLVATQLNRYLPNFVLAHKLHVPASITTLYQATTKQATTYNGVADAAFLSQIWF